MEGKKKLPVKEVSRMLKVSGRQVTRYINEGKLSAEKQGKAFLIDYDSVLAFQKDNTYSKQDTGIAQEMDVREEPGADGDMSNVQDAEPDVREAICTRQMEVLKMSVEEPAVSDMDGHEDMDSLKRRLHFEQARNELIQARLSELLRQLQFSPKDLRKSSSRRRRDRRLLRWVLVFSLINLVMLLAVLFPLYGR